jgi:hypothetical protein
MARIGSYTVVVKCRRRDASRTADAGRNDPPRECGLLLALKARQIKCAMALLDAGADAGARDADGVGAVRVPASRARRSPR